MAGIMNKLKDMWKPPEDEVEYEDNSYYDNDSAVDDGGVYETEEEYGPAYEEPEPPQQYVQRPAPRQTAPRHLNLAVRLSISTQLLVCR